MITLLITKSVRMEIPSQSQEVSVARDQNVMLISFIFHYCRHVLNLHFT